MLARKSSPALLKRLMALPLEQLERLPAKDWEGLTHDDSRRLASYILQHGPPEDRELVDLAGRAKSSLVHELAAALDAYGEMSMRQDYGYAGEWLERLAARWRAEGEESKFEQLGDAFLSPEVLGLLAALESSLVLAASAYEPHRALRLDGPEIEERMTVVGLEGVWGDWDQVLDAAERKAEHRSPRRVERKPHPAPTKPTTRTPRRRERNARVREALALLRETMAETGVLYRELAPDGRELSAEQRAEALELLETGAVCARTLDIDHDLIPQADHDFCAPAFAVIRSLHRSLVLALSDDPKRRAQAMPLGEARARAFIANEQLAHGASRTEAWQALQAATAG